MSFSNVDVGSVDKRTLLQFGIMVSCATGRFPMAYNDYGNYCGVGGSGNPVDGVDRYRLWINNIRLVASFARSVGARCVVGREEESRSEIL